MRASDLCDVKALADRIHPDLPERIEVFADRLAVFPEGSLVLGDAGEISGYGVSHPWRLFAPPALDALLLRLPDDADSFYIHDVVVAPERRGQGLAQAGVEALLVAAAAFPVTALMSVYGTLSFWSRFGFADETASLPAEKLAPYGADARYMVRRTSLMSVDIAPFGDEVQKD